MRFPRISIAAAAYVSILAGCTHPPREESVPSRVTRRECLAMAEAYRSHQWTPTAANVRHGVDAQGVRLDTPDASYHPGSKISGWWVPGRQTEGVPYQWGGFSTVEEFDAGLKDGKAAGDASSPVKRALLDDAVTAEAVGIDCSGYISRLWHLPRAYSTRELPGLCNEIQWEALKPGDILNTHNAHCLLFAGWDDEMHVRLIAYETGSPPTWRVLSHTIDVAWLKSLGYQAWRYRGIVN